MGTSLTEKTPAQAVQLSLTCGAFRCVASHFHALSRPGDVPLHLWLHCHRYVYAEMLAAKLKQLAASAVLNIVFSDESDDAVLKLIDFDASVTRRDLDTGDMLRGPAGTLSYMSPVMFNRVEDMGTWRIPRLPFCALASPYQDVERKGAFHSTRLHSGLPRRFRWRRSRLPRGGLRERHPRK